MYKLLVVEDDELTSEMLRRYFEIVGYEVLSAATGDEAIKLAKEQNPTVIILDIILPDMDGYEVCRRMRDSDEMEYIPIIFLTQKGERRDRLDGLRLGVDDYITKPFDVDELRLRVHNIIIRMGGSPLVDARTGLPNPNQIRERLPQLLKDSNNAYLDIRVVHFEPFSKRYGPVAANQVVRTTARIIADLLHKADPINSFIGHIADQEFLIAIPEKKIKQVYAELPGHFKTHITKFYDYEDASRGKIRVEDKLYPLMEVDLKRVSAESVKARLTGRKLALPDGDVTLTGGNKSMALIVLPKKRTSLMLPSGDQAPPRPKTAPDEDASEKPPT